MFQVKPYLRAMVCTEAIGPAIFRHSPFTSSNGQSASTSRQMAFHLRLSRSSIALDNLSRSSSLHNPRYNGSLKGQKPILRSRGAPNQWPSPPAPPSRARRPSQKAVYNTSELPQGCHPSSKRPRRLSPTFEALQRPTELLFRRSERRQLQIFPFSQEPRGFPRGLM